VEDSTGTAIATQSARHEDIKTAPLAAAAISCGDVPETLIDSRSRWFQLDLPELWRYRELLFFFTWRDIKVRYKQTELGVLWVVIQPLFTTGIFVVLFGLLMGRGNEPTMPGVPYALSTFCAMLPWQFFAESLTRSGNSLVTAQNIITKIYFPRLILPLSGVLSAMVDFAIAAVALGIMMGVYGVWPSWALLTLPLFVLFAAIAALAVGLWLSALAAIYRDFLYVQPFLIRVGMYVSPVIYATANLKEKLPDWALAVYALNPMVGHRGIPLGFVGNRQLARARSNPIDPDDPDSPCRRCPLFPPHGRDRGGRYLRASRLSDAGLLPPDNSFLAGASADD
jgi:lipopolysaccharide transport system permease protein